MRAKLKRVFQAAAVLITLGGGVAGSLLVANQQEPEPLTCAQWGRALEFSRRKTDTYHLAISQGFTPPKAVGSRILGECGGGSCLLATPCEGKDVRYPFEASPVVGGRRLVRVTSSSYFTGGWKALAAAAPEVEFWGTFGEVQDACLAATTQAECLALMQPLGDCWEQTFGDLCRYGRVYTTNRPGVDETCAPAAGDRWYPCTDHGHGTRWGERSLTEELPPDEELDL